MKRSGAHILTVGMCLLLISCSGSSDELSCTDPVWNVEFGICLPEGWEEVSQDTLEEKQVPEETLAVYRIAEKRAGQRDNLVVSREILNADLSSRAYAEQNITTIEVTPEYALLEKATISIDGEETLLHTFTAKPVAELPARRFYQLSLTNGRKGYTFTASLPFTVERSVESMVTQILQNITLVEPEA